MTALRSPDSIDAVRPASTTAPSQSTFDDAVRAWVASAPVALWVGVIVVGSTIVHFLLALTVAAPWIIPDELIYSELAKSFASSGHFAVRDLPFAVWSYGPIYPILIAPAYRLATSVPDAYVLVKAINSLAMSTAAIPGYLLARRVLSRNASLLASVMTVLVPSLVYTTKFMTENVSYPIFLFAMVAIVRLLEQQSVGRQFAALALIGLAMLARAQMVVLLPAVLTAAVALSWVEDGSVVLAVRRAFRSMRLTWCASLAGLLVLVAWRLIGSSDEGTVLGAHARAVHGTTPLGFARWFVYHLAEIDLYAGVIPFAVFLVMLLRVLARRESSRAVRVFMIASGAIFFWLLALAALYMSERSVGRVFDRYVFYAVPLMLISLLIWIRGGLQRPRRAMVAIAAFAWLLPAVLPFGLLLDGTEWGTSSSAVGLVPWYLVRELTGLSGVDLLFVAVVLAVTGALARLVLRSSTGRPLVRATMIYLVAVGLVAQLANASVADRASNLGFGTASPQWVDRVVGPGAKVAVIWTGTARRGANGWYTIWETEFFNRSVGAVYYLNEPLRYAMLLPDAKTSISGSTLVGPGGRPVRSGFVLTDVTFPIAGQVVARDSTRGMTLYRVNGPVRLRRGTGAPSVAMVTD